MTESHTIAKNTTWLTLAYILQKILAFIYFTLIARRLGANNIGMYAFAVSLTTIISIFIDFGISPVLIRESSKYKNKANLYLNVSNSLKLAFAIASYMAAVIIVNLLHKPPLIQTMVYIAGIIMILDSFSLSFWAIFRAYQNLKYESISIIINQILIVSVGLAGVLLKFPLYILVIALFSGSIFSFLYSFFLLKTKLKFQFKLQWQKEIAKTILKIAIPFALAGIFVRFYTFIDQVLLSILINDKTLGWYSVAYKITYALQFVPAAFAAAIFPAMSHYYVNAKEKLQMVFEKSMYFLIIISIPTALGVSILADKIILSLYGHDFQPSILTLQIFVLAVIPIFLNYPCGSVLNACDRQTRNTLNMGITMLINIILHIILIPRYQQIGAAVATLISLLVLFILNLSVVPKIIKFDYKFLLIKTLKSLLSVSIMAILLFSIKSYFNFIILIIAGAIIYIGIMYLIKGFTKDDLKYLIQTIFKKEKNISEIPEEEALTST